MTKYNRINSKSVAEAVKKHIEEHLQDKLEVYELTKIEDFLKIRKKDAKKSIPNKKYINTYDLVKYMTESCLDFEWEHFEQALFISSIGLSRKYGEVAVFERYVEVLAYHIEKLYNIK